jgi:hypothetical protein
MEVFHMAKKKVKKVKKTVKAKKVTGKKKVTRSKKAVKAKVPAKSKEKVLGKIEHYFDKISVAAISVRAPFKVGDVIHIKGHTTDFYQRVDSMQIEHQSVTKVKKGDDIGIKVKEFVRGHDLVYLGSEKDLMKQTVKPAAAIQTSIFKKEDKPILKAAPSIAALPKPVAPSSPPPPKTESKKQDPYSEKKFFSF